MINLRKKVLFVIPLTIAIIIVIVISFYRNDRNVATEIDSPFSQVNSEEAQIEEPIDETDNTMAIVDIKGAIKHPGIYEISLDKRVDDVLELAGGLTKKADDMAINRAEKVYDEMVIVVPIEGDETPPNVNPHNPTDKIRINNATQQEIETLSGIGPSKAETIIQYREENGPFKKIEDLLEVSGIGEKTFENLKDDILVP